MSFVGCLCLCGFWLFYSSGEIFCQPFRENTFSKKLTQNEQVTRIFDFQCPKRDFVANHLESSRAPNCCLIESVNRMDAEDKYREAEQIEDVWQQTVLKCNLHASAKTNFRLIYTYKADGYTNIKHTHCQWKSLNFQYLWSICFLGVFSKMRPPRRAGQRTSTNYENPQMFGS